MLRNLVSIAPSIFLYPKAETPNAIQPNIGVIALETQAILIDGGNSPRHAKQIMATLKQQALPPVTTIILTHHHWDHSFGAATIAAPTIIAHERCAEHLAAYRQREWNPTILREEISRNPRSELSNNALIDAISNWRDLQIVQPTMTFSHHLTRYFDDMVIELVHVGGIHADDSIIVKLPQQQVMFLGDCYYPKPYAERDADDEDLDLEMLALLLADEYDVYIDGHGSPRSHAEFDKMVQWERGRQGLS